MSTEFHDDCPPRERLSALLDGETGAAASVAACAWWCEDAGARRDWHSWHLIGDALRSDELASTAGCDARLLAALRARLAGEQPLRPATVVSLDAERAARVARRPVRWMLPSAMAAGLVLVVGTFALVRPFQEPSGVPSQLASAGVAARPAPVPPLTSAALGDTGDRQSFTVTDAKMIRDARLERYLAAHKQFTGSSALGVPSAFLRSATVESTVR